jgi:hypothetical protein
MTPIEVEIAGKTYLVRIYDDKPAYVELIYHRKDGASYVRHYRKVAQGTPRWMAAAGLARKKTQ